MRKVRCSLFAVALLGLGPLPTAPAAQAHHLPDPRQVTVVLSPSGVHAPDALAADRYLLKVRAAPRQVPGMLQLVKPDRGYTRAELRADGRGGGRAAERRLLANLRYFGGSEVRAGGSGALWETLYSGRYWLVGAARSGVSIKTIRVHGTPSLSAFPRVSAAATGTDKGLRLTRRTTQTGRMLIRNMSSGLDALVFLPLHEGTTYADFLGWTRRPTRDMPIRSQGARTSATLSPDSGYVLRYRLRPGDYVVMSSSSLNAASGPRTLQPVFHPLTVLPNTGTDSARAAVSRGTEGFAKTPAVARRIERWLATTDRDRAPLARRLAAGPMRRSLSNPAGTAKAKQASWPTG